MKRIATGWQYAVYDLGNNRVLKRYHSLLAAVCIMMVDISVDLFRLRRHAYWEIPEIIRELDQFARAAIEGIAAHPEFPAKWFGFPKFVGELDYEQDKVIPLRAAFHKCVSDEERKVLIDQFVEFSKELFLHGMIERNFNIGENFGVNTSGGIILVDLGELVFDQNTITLQVKNRAWVNASARRCFPGEELRAYYEKRMEEAYASLLNEQ